MEGGTQTGGAPRPPGRARSRRAGRAQGTLLALAGGALLALALARSGAIGPREAERAGDAGPPAEAIAGLASVSGADGARLLPLGAVPGGAFRARRLAERLGLAGEPWLLELEGSWAGDGPLDGLCVRDGRGVALERPPGAERAARSEDPLERLFGGASLEGPAGSRRLCLWGRVPDAGAWLERGGERLELGPWRPDARRVRALVALGSAIGAIDAVGEATRAGADDSARGALREAQGDPHALAREVARLREELRRQEERRIEREAAWLSYNRSLAALGRPADGVEPFEVDHEALGEPPPAPVESPRPAASEPAAPPVPDPRARRLEELARSLRAFLVLADLWSYDLLEIGGFRDEPPYRGVGPVVFRLLDDRGRLAGSLVAERLRMEGSRAGRTVSLVLEDGHESHGGERVPFAGGVRRIPVPFLDPEPWFESCPELFPEGAFADVNDDGRWDREALRRELNRLLALDLEAGWYRFRGIGGVLNGELRDVQIEVLDRNGRVLRRLFADRVTLRAEAPGMALLLRDGVVVRGGEKEAFRDGVHRLYLPRARPQEWRDAGLPGLPREAAQDAAPPAGDAPPEPQPPAAGGERG